MNEKIKELDLDTINRLLTEAGIFYPKFLDPQSTLASKEEDNGKTRFQYLGELTRLTGIEDASGAIQTLREEQKSRIQAPEQPIQTTPSQETLERSGEVLARQREKEAAARQVAQKQNEIFLKSVTQPKPVQIPPEQGKKLQEAITLAKTNPPDFIKQFVDEARKEENIPEGFTPEAVAYIAPFIAVEVVTKLEAFTQEEVVVEVVPPYNPAGVLAALANPELTVLKNAFPEAAEREKVAQDFAFSGAVAAAQYDLVGKIVSKVYGQEVFVSLYGAPEITTFSVSNNPEGAIKVDLNEAVKTASEIKTSKEKRQQGLRVSQNPVRYLQQEWGNSINLQPNFVPLKNFLSSLGNEFFPKEGNFSYSGNINDLPTFQAYQIAHLGTIGQTVSVLDWDLNKLNNTINIPLPTLGLSTEGVTLGIGPFQKIISGPGINTAIKKVSTTLAGKVGKTLAVQGAAQTVGATAGGVAGTLAGIFATPLGGILVGAIVNFATKAISWLSRKIKEHPKNFAIGSLVALLGGIFIGSIPLMVVGGLALGATTLAGSGLASLQSAALGLAGLFGIAMKTALTEIAKPLLISFLSLPVLVALIMFIINSGAYIVPQGSLFGLSTEVDVRGSCPLTGDHFISTSSLNGSIGHGGSIYWGNTPVADRYAIPIYAQFPPSSSHPNGCSGSTCLYYGFATDVNPTTTNPNAVVIAPANFCDTSDNCVTSWVVSQIIPHPYGWGTGVILRSAGGPGPTYQMYLAHLDSNTVATNTLLEEGATLPTGTVLAPLSKNLDKPHVHIELNVNGIPVRPDFLCQ